MAMSDLIIGLSLIIGSGVIGLVAAIVIPIVILYRRSHTLILRDPTSDRDRVTKYLMYEKKDKHTGELVWKSRFFSKSYQCEKPPTKAIDLDRRGNSVAQAIKIGEKQHLWLRPKPFQISKITEVDENTGEEIEKTAITGLDIDGKEQVIAFHEPFDATDKLTLMAQHEKAELHNKKKWTAEKVINLVALTMMGFIIMLAFVFGGDIMKANKVNLEVQNNNLRITNEIAKTNQMTMQNIQRIAEALDVKIDQVDEIKGDPLIISDNEELPNGSRDRTD